MADAVICDRCNKTITNNFWYVHSNYYTVPFIFGSSRKTFDFDLCEKCMDDFKHFLLTKE